MQPGNFLSNVTFKLKSKPTKMSLTPDSISNFVTSTFGKLCFSVSKTRFMRVRSLAGGLCALISVGPLAAELRFEGCVIWDDFTYGFGLQAADLDHDGFIDLTCADTSGFVQAEPYAGESGAGAWPDDAGIRRPAKSKDPSPANSHFYWFKNDGQGNFEKRFITRDDPQRRLERHVIHDVDADGWLDLVVVDNLLGDVVWFQNPGEKGLSRKNLWKKRFIAKGTLFGAVDVTVGDFDGDGKVDIAGAGWRLGNYFKWFRNPGNVLEVESWSDYLIDGGFPGATCVHAGDIDGDGRTDVLATSMDSRAILWYKAPLDPVVEGWQRNVIDLVPSPQPVYARLVDMNNDGRQDALISWGGYLPPPVAGQPRAGSVVWYENAGEADGRVQWRKWVVSNDMPAAVNVAVADFNLDGALDVVAVSYMPGEVAWFENAGDPKARWTKHTIKDTFPNGNGIVTADFDEDGRPDVAALADYGSMELRWWRNRKSNGK